MVRAALVLNCWKTMERASASNVGSRYAICGAPTRSMIEARIGSEDLRWVRAFCMTGYSTRNRLWRFQIMLGARPSGDRVIARDRVINKTKMMAGTGFPITRSPDHRITRFLRDAHFFVRPIHLAQRFANLTH